MYTVVERKVSCPVLPGVELWLSTLQSVVQVCCNGSIYSDSDVKIVWCHSMYIMTANRDKLHVTSFSFPYSLFSLTVGTGQCEGVYVYFVTAEYPQLGHC
jgi:hypothetical protein